MALWTIPNDPNLPARTRRALQRAINAVLNKSASAVTVATVASATTLELATVTSEIILITGTTTITAFNHDVAGAERRMIFNGILTLTHGSGLQLQGAADILTAVGDYAEFYCVDGSNWEMTIYERYSGLSLRGGYTATSVSSNTIGISGAELTFTTQTFLEYVAGMRVRVLDLDAGGWMEGVVTSYSGSTLKFYADCYSGSGTSANWSINLGSFDLFGSLIFGAGQRKVTFLDLLTRKSTNVASASTVDLRSVLTGGTIDGVSCFVTGTTTINVLTGSEQPGAIRILHFEGSLGISAASINLPGGSTIVTAAGDVGIFQYNVGGDNHWRCISYTRASGLPVVGYTADESTLHLSGSTFSIKSTYVGQSSIVTVGTLTGGATGAGFTIALTTSTVTGTLPVANLTSLTTLTAADVALADEIPEYNIAATANRKITATKLLGQSSSSICEGRLTLTTATSVTTADVTGATSIYFTPHNGDRITIYDGTRLLMYSFTELTLALGTLVNAQGYDVFIYDNAGTLTLEALEWTNATITCTSASPGVVTWTAHGLATGNSVTFTNSGGGLPTGISANVQYWITKIDANTFKISTTMANVAAGTFVNTSSTGTGTHTGHSPTLRATALVRQNGAWYKTGALTRRYLGSFFTTATTTTESSLANRYLFNAYNQIQLPMKVQDSTSSWNYTTAAFRQARATDGNRINFFNGLAEKQVEATVVAFASDTSNGMMLSGIGLDSTSTDSSILSINNNAASNFISTTFAQYKAQPSIGFHSLVWLEYAQALGTASWYGQGSANVGNLGHSGLSASIWC